MYTRTLRWNIYLSIVFILNVLSKGISKLVKSFANEAIEFNCRCVYECVRVYKYVKVSVYVSPTSWPQQGYKDDWSRVTARTSRCVVQSR